MPEAAPGAESGIDEAVFEEGPRYLQDDRKVKDDKMASPGGKRPLEFLSHRSPRGGEGNHPPGERADQDLRLDRRCE